MKIYFSILIFVSFYTVTSSAANKVKEILSSTRDTTTVHEYLSIAAKKLSAGEADSAEVYFKRATDLARSLNVYSLEMRSMEKHIGFLHRQLKFEEALRICEHILERATEKKDDPRIASTFNNMGVLHQAMGKLQTAAENYIKALSLAEKIGHHENQAKFNSNLASIFIDLKDKEKALHYAQKGYAIALDMKDSAWISNSLVNLSCSEILNELYDDAINHLNLMIDISFRLDNKDRVLDGYLNLGDIFIRKKHYTAALDIFLRAERGLRASTPPDYSIYIYHGLAVSYFHLKDFAKSQYYYDKLLPDVENSFPKNELKEIYHFGAELKENLGLYQDAFALQKKYTMLKDSLFDADSWSDIQELELKYQHTLKEKTLAEQQLVIARHEHAIERKNKIIVLVVGAILFLVTVAIIIFIIYAFRRRSQKNEQQFALLKAQLMGEEKERARQAKELHDGVSGLLAAAKVHLSNIANADHNKEPYEKVLLLLHKANNEVRDISHNLAPEIVLEHGLQHAIADFVARISHPNLQIQFSVIGEVPRMKPEFELFIYRAVQESLNNVMKHAQATSALVQLTCLESLLTVTIEDNGIGFDVENPSAKGLGLSNLTSRIQGMHGNIEVTSSPGSGTTVYLEVGITGHSLSSASTNAPLHSKPVRSH